MHSLRSYFLKNTQWDTYLHIVQHTYNRATHSATSYLPFEVCIVFHPLSLVNLPLTLTLNGTTRHQKDQQSAHQFLQKLAQRHTQAIEVLKLAQDKAKEHHDKDKKTLEFSCGDKVWLQMDKHHFRGGHHKLHPLRYGPYTIIERISENAYRLDLPPQLGIHAVINVNKLKLYVLLLLDGEVTITRRVDNIL